MKTIIQTPDAPSPIGPYSQAVRTGPLLFVSGQVAIDPSTNQYIPGDARTETARVMENIGAVLSAAGMGFGHIVKTTIFLADMADFAAVNEVYGGYFTGNFPARETVQVSVLPRNARVEISVVASSEL